MRGARVIVAGVLGAVLHVAGPLDVSAAQGTCAGVAGVDQLLAPGVVVLVGEVHGTAESPSFVSALLNAMGAGFPVTVRSRFRSTRPHGSTPSSRLAVLKRIVQRSSPVRSGHRAWPMAEAARDGRPARRRTRCGCGRDVDRSHAARPGGRRSRCGHGRERRRGGRCQSGRHRHRAHRQRAHSRCSPTRPATRRSSRWDSR